MPEEIEQSWRRSVSHHVNPTGGPHILGEIDPDSAILRAAGRILDQWQDNLTDTRMALFLADEEGRIVSRRIIDAQDTRTLDNAYAAEGFVFSEKALGTNGLGTPIEGRGVVFVRGTEHFNDALAQLACAGAPIKHPITGRIVGSLSIASHVDAASPLMVSMARQAGHQIAEALELMADSRNLELARTYRRFQSSKNPVLVMNSETVMTDLPALAHFDAESHAYLWEMLRRHQWDQDKVQLELPLLGTEAVIRRLGRPGQDAIFALEFTRPAGAEGAGPETARTPQKADAPGLREVLNGLSSRQARTTTSYSALQQQISKAAALDGLIRVMGGPGVGKRHQSSKWLRQRAGRQPDTFTSDELTSDASAWTRMQAALAEGRGVIVEGKTVPDGLLERLITFARAGAPGAHPGARVILTQRPTGWEGQGEEVPGLPVPVYVPSLGDVREELPEIIREVSAELFPGVQAPRFSPAALQCLFAWRWPGNVGELARLLAALRHSAGNGLVETKDLPTAMRQTSLPSLSRYEQSERDAIVSALAEAEGNKSRAAEILGIGRTTMYRKMRSLKINADERMILPGA
ncbi:helix-turn-helix domain-containing protein [Pseudarthrobacter sp. NPDC058119]|uniref:helix-turn-helix domain-containing protein n=1 Tax=Pseudarthrobacter sp. NPDC058119 TaxID=3346348 RepID=UPI0036DDE869